MKDDEAISVGGGGEGNCPLLTAYCHRWCCGGERGLRTLISTSGDVSHRNVGAQHCAPILCKEMVYNHVGAGLPRPISFACFFQKLAMHKKRDGLRTAPT
jgi:hypothetical protein